MGNILLVMPNEYTAVDPDSLYQQTAVTSSQLQQAAQDGALADLNDMLRAGGYLTGDQTVLEVFESPTGEFYFRIEG